MTGHSSEVRRRRPARFALCLDELDDRCLLSGFSPGFSPAETHRPRSPRPMTSPTLPSHQKRASPSRATAAVRRSRSSRCTTIRTFSRIWRHLMQNMVLPGAVAHGRRPGAGARPIVGGALEESLDVEWAAHAIAARRQHPGGGEARRHPYSQTVELQNLLNAVNTARNTAGVVAVSMSWGFSEVQNESSYDSTFTTPAGHEGVTFLSRRAETMGRC